jgi:hypothetical protein
MFRMLTCFDLAPGVEIGAFRAAYSDFVAHMQGIDLVAGTGSIGRRSTWPMGNSCCTKSPRTRSTTRSDP